MPASSVTLVPRPKPLPGAVLEHDHRPIGRPVDLGRHEGEPVGQSGDPGRHARPAMRADVDVHVARREPGRGAQVTGQQADRPAEEVLLGTGQVDEVRRVDGDGPDVELDQALAEGRALGRGRCAAPPGGRVVGEHLERVGADLVSPVDRLDHAAAEREVGAEASSIGKHPRHGTTRMRCDSLARSFGRGRD